MIDEKKWKATHGSLWLVLNAANKDENYSPYCMRCPGTKRMKKVEELYWNCKCGAECDLREYKK